jgi:hypothetical protein
VVRHHVGDLLLDLVEAITDAREALVRAELEESLRAPAIKGDFGIRRVDTIRASLGGVTPPPSPVSFDKRSEPDRMLADNRRKPVTAV